MAAKKNARLFLTIAYVISCYARYIAHIACPDMEDVTDEGATRTHIFIEDLPQLSSRTDLLSRSPVRHDLVHDVMFVVKQKNMDKLTRMLHDVSDPDSPNYGQHMSGEQVHALTSNPEARDAIVNYLNTNGATVITESVSGDLITATAPIFVWERLFDTKFYTFDHRQSKGNTQQIVRAEKYSIAVELSLHAESVLNVIEMPYNELRPTKLSTSSLLEGNKNQFEGQGVHPAGYLRPQEIRAYYNLSNVYGSALSTQGAVAFGAIYFSPKSLAYFQQNISYQALQPALNIGGFESDDPTKDSSEGNLDIQYIMGISPGSPTTFWHNPGGFFTWLTEVLATPNPPLVLSISYGTPELYTSLGTHKYVTNLAKKVGMRGISLVVASGDDGAVGSDARGNPSKCSYQPYFPAGNPYFTAIGATSGPELRKAEAVNQWDLGQHITSGGGFSKYYSQPSWQKSAVASYIKARDASKQMPVTGYNTSNRGYPDLSIVGLNFFVRIPDAKSPLGVTAVMAGTSASCPVAAAFFTNINAARLAAGKGSIGWVNPALYAKAASFVNDVTSGDNKSPNFGPVCSQGYYATKGWDPTTGWGSVNYKKMQETFLSLGNVNGFSTAPTVSPTAKPTSPPVPSMLPTRSPSAVPSKAIPSSAPTPLPSLAPSISPYPTSAPTAPPSTPPTVTQTPAPTINALSNSDGGLFYPFIRKISRYPTNGPHSTAYPSSAISSIIEIYQSFAGLSTEQLSGDAFLSAIESSISDTIGVSAHVTTDIIIAPRLTLTSTSTSNDVVNLLFTVNSTSGLRSDELIIRLKNSMVCGDFYSSLSAYSGIAFTNLTSAVYVDATGTLSSSSAAPTRINVLSNEPPPEVVAGATVGAVAGAFIIAYLILVCHRSKKFRKERIEIHTLDLSATCYCISPTSTIAYNTV